MHFWIAGKLYIMNRTLTLASFPGGNKPTLLVQVSWSWAWNPQFKGRFFYFIDFFFFPVRFFIFQNSKKKVQIHSCDFHLSMIFLVSGSLKLPWAICVSEDCFWVELKGLWICWIITGWNHPSDQDVGLCGYCFVCWFLCCVLFIVGILRLM